MAPGLTNEVLLAEQGARCVAGIDEAGRGCWAGPVVAAAVVLPPAVLQYPDLLAGIDDSKLLSADQRTSGSARIRAHARAVGVGVAPAFLIDAFGILAATRLAMLTALLALDCPVDALLIDAVRLDGLSLPQQVLIRGDACSLSIAAASVIAKVTRDRLMATADSAFPGYGFARHKGYGTALHHQALQARGPCLLHRLTFRPVAAIVAAQQEPEERYGLTRDPNR